MLYFVFKPNERLLYCLQISGFCLLTAMGNVANTAKSPLAAQDFMLLTVRGAETCFLNIATC